MAGAEDEVEPAEVELLDERWKQRETLPVVMPHSRQPLQRGSVDAQALDRRRYRSPDVQQGEKLGLGKSLAQHLEHFLSAAHAGQPVVYEGNFHVAVM